MHPYYNSHNKQYRKEISGLCSVIGSELEDAYGVPYYRNETIACGDVCCANLVKRNAPVIMDNYPPHCLRGDGLK